jgi:hypothetical protein
VAEPPPPRGMIWVDDSGQASPTVAATAAWSAKKAAANTFQFRNRLSLLGHDVSGRRIQCVRPFHHGLVHMPGRQIRPRRHHPLGRRPLMSYKDPPARNRLCEYPEFRGWATVRCGSTDNRESHALTSQCGTAPNGHLRHDLAAAGIALPFHPFRPAAASGEKSSVVADYAQTCAKANLGHFRCREATARR